ncbi:MAG: signal peptidase I [Negativicutes bacterium]|jgi:signal peptidase I
MQDRLLNTAGCRLENHQEEACHEIQKIQNPHPDISQVICEGNSMFPTLRNGDILFADRQAKVRAGDIVVYSTADGQRIVHRLVAHCESGLLTQGDNNRLPDSDLVSKEQVLGKILFGFRGRKTINCKNGKTGMLRFRLFQTRVQAKYHGFIVCRWLYRLLFDEQTLKKFCRHRKQRKED